MVDEKYPLSVFEKRKQDKREKIKKVAGRVALGGALVIGNITAGVIFEKGMERIQGLEKRVGVLETVTDNLMVKEAGLVGQQCMTEGHIAYVEGQPVTYDMAKAYCDEQVRQELDYWRSVIEEAEGGSKITKTKTD